MKTKEFFIHNLKMQKHIEGGYYVENYESKESIGNRPLASSIHFLLTKDNFSALHALDADEIWYYHYGSPLKVEVIHPDGLHETISIGPELDQGQVLQYCVPKGAIFGSHVDADFSVVGCMVAPAFHYEGFELLSREDLLKTYPQHEDIIIKLTRI